MSKRMQQIESSIDKTKKNTLQEAIEILKKNSKVKFDETVEVHIKLGIDPKQTDQTVRGSVMLPNGTGKSPKVAVVTTGEKLKEAENSGADYFGYEDLIAKISKGWLDFDVLVATPDTMKNLSKLGKLLGPKGLMPNPKTGTVTFDITRIVKELKLGRIQFKNDSYGIIHCPAGKLSFDIEKLVENINVLLETINKLKPQKSKGQYLKTIHISSTMGPSLCIT